MFRALMAAAFALALLAMPQSAHAQARKVSQTAVGSWQVIGWVAPSGMGYCSAEKSIEDGVVGFVRVPDGYLLIVRSAVLPVDQQQTYRVRYAAAQVTQGESEGRGIAPSMILFRITSDSSLMQRIAAGAAQFDVTIDGVTVSIPLEGFQKALSELENCLVQRQRANAPAGPGQQPAAQPAQPAQFPGGPLDMPKLNEPGVLPRKAF